MGVGVEELVLLPLVVSVVRVLSATIVNKF